MKNINDLPEGDGILCSTYDVFRRLIALKGTAIPALENQWNVFESKTILTFNKDSEPVVYDSDKFSKQVHFPYEFLEPNDNSEVLVPTEYPPGVLNENCSKSPIINPLLGVMPKKQWLEERLSKIERAISERLNTNHEIPSEWIEERNWILELLSNETNAQG